jgi:alpha-1,6-mannosyltransferase
VKRFTALSIFLYLLLAVFYSIPGWSDSPITREIILWPVIGVLLALYAVVYRRVANGGISRRSLVLSGILLALAAVLIPPFHSTDVFGYINRGWQQAHYGLNPYVFTVDRIPGWERDPMITDHWVNNPSPYGFLYLLIAKMLCVWGGGMWGGGSKAATLFLFKLSNLVVHLATAALLWWGASRLQRQGAAIRADAALFLYLWNPLILLHGLANAHNDLWMGFFLLLTAGCALIGAWLWMLPALMASALIKYASVVTAPFAVLLLIRQKAWKPLAGGTLLALLVFGLCGWPYLADWANFHLKEIGRNALVSHGSLHSFVYSGWKILAHTSAPDWPARKEAVRVALANVLMTAYALFYITLFLRRWRQPTGYPAAAWLRDALLAMLALITLASLKFYPWYLGMFFPLALLLREGDWLRRFTVSLSGAQLLAFTLVGQAHLLNFLLMTGVPWLGVALPGLGWTKRRIALTAGGVTGVLFLIALIVGDG